MSSQPPAGPGATGGPAIDLFANILRDDERGGAAYGEFVELFRSMQDAVVSANPPEGVWGDLAARLREAIDLLGPWWVPEWQRPAGLRTDLPGRGNPLLMPFVPQEESDDHIRGRVTFRPFHLGGNGAAHGGTLPMLFDDVMGHLASLGGRSVARTAFLKVNYRSITPLGVDLEVRATVDRIDGRKRWLSGRLTDGETLVADAEALFVELLPGQQ
ncbi:MAG TPA: PaaI family thioesterase [Acidimicrobiales bacterium]|nr:PaaI family thioesterase [Acidimicrobiales bacterium]